MTNNQAVIYSFCLYVLYVLLPLIPAVLIFRLFPDTKVSVAGPLQNLTLNATGAFAAYVVTVALGFFLVKNVEVQINSTRLYAVEGVIVDLSRNQFVSSDRFYSRYVIAGIDPSLLPPSRNYNFVVLLDHPVVNRETVWLQYWEVNIVGGVGQPPIPRSIPLELLPSSSEQRFRLQVKDGGITVVHETVAQSAREQKIQIAMKGGGQCASRVLSPASY